MAVRKRNALRFLPKSNSVRPQPSVGFKGTARDIHATDKRKAAESRRFARLVAAAYARSPPVEVGSVSAQARAFSLAIRLERPNLVRVILPALTSRYRLERPIGYSVKNSTIVK